MESLEKKEEGLFEKGVGKTIDFIFSDDIRKWLILIVVFGFILRAINVKTRMIYADPAHFVANAINFLNSGLLSLWDQSSFLWYASTDISYKIFGVTQFASRFSSLLLGTLTIIALYLFVKEFSGSKQLGIVTATIYAFAPVFIFNAADEHDISALFFIVMIFYFLIKGIKNNSKKYLIFSGGVLAIAAMWKMYAAILIVPYIGTLLYFNYKKEFNIKSHLKTFAIIFIIMFLIVSPVFIYNYLNYKHNKVTTMFFSKFLGIENDKMTKLYGWDPGYKNKFSYSVIFTGLKNSLYSNSPILWILVVIGMARSLIKLKNKKEKFSKDYLVFYFFYFLIPYFFLIESNTLGKHYIHFLVFALPFVSILVMDLYNQINSKTKISEFIKKNIVLIIIILIIFQIFVIMSLPQGPNKELFFYGNPENKFMKYKAENIPEESLIVYDDRIYNSLAGWIFNDRYYIPVSFFGQFMSANEKSNNKKAIPVFLVECGIDDCGWGTVHKNQNLNESMEGFFMSIKNQSVPEVFAVKGQLRGLNYYNPLINNIKPKGDYFKIYKTNLAIDINLAKSVKKQYNYFMYPLRYENKNDKVFQNFIYEPKGFIEKSLNGIAWLIFYFDIILSFVIAIIVVTELYKSK